jgi:hypothetical protein
MGDRRKRDAAYESIEDKSDGSLAPRDRGAIFRLLK